MPLGSFTADLTRFVQKAKANADMVFGKSCLEIFARVAERTPVDTGRCRVGWQPGINAMPSGSDPGALKQMVRKARLTAAPPLSSADKGKIATALLGLKFGDTAWLVNNVHYVQYLEYGTASYGFSPQAPAGMVRITLSEWTAAVEKAAAGLK